MVRQYPYVCNWFDVTDGGTDENGFPIPSEEIARTANCRYDAFKQGNYREFYDESGVKLEATGVIYFKKGSIYPERFRTVTIDEYNLKADVIHSYTGQLNTTVFVQEL